MSAASDFRRNWRYSRRSHHSIESLDMVQGRVLDLRRDMGYVYAPEPSLLTWSDQSGGGYHCTAPAAANQPTVVATGVDFDGAASPDGDYLVNSDLGTALGTVSDLYVAVVFRADVTSDNDGIVALTNLGTTDKLAIMLVANALWFRIGGVGDVTTPFTDTAQAHVAESVLSSGVLQPYLDGTPLDTLAAGAVALGGLNLSIGAYYAPQFCFNGVIANVLISTDISAENVALARRVLMRDMP